MSGGFVAASNRVNGACPYEPGNTVLNADWFVYTCNCSSTCRQAGRKACKDRSKTESNVVPLAAAKASAGKKE
eukprot:4716502-Alexandrium_andersonii.AAC.1